VCSTSKLVVGKSRMRAFDQQMFKIIQVNIHFRKALSQTTQPVVTQATAVVSSNSS